MYPADNQPIWYPLHGDGLSNALGDYGQARVVNDQYPILVDLDDYPEFYVPLPNETGSMFPGYPGWRMALFSPSPGLYVTPAMGRMLLLSHGWSDYSYVTRAGDDPELDDAMTAIAYRPSSDTSTITPSDFQYNPYSRF